MDFDYRPYSKTTITKCGKRYIMKIPEYVTPALFCELIGKNADSFMTTHRHEIPRDNDTELIKFRQALRWYSSFIEERTKTEEKKDEINQLKEELLRHRVRLQKAKATQQELKTKEMKGKIVTTNEMTKDISELAVLFKQSLEDLPGTFAITLANKPAGFIKNQLTKKVNEILNNIAEKIQS